jgi:hypothetical protein
MNDSPVTAGIRRARLGHLTDTLKRVPRTIKGSMGPKR